MSLKHAILGFLSFTPLSGYDLKKAFDNSVRHFWPANQSQIYRTLAQLEEEGFVTKEVIEREERLDLKLYHISEAGRVEIHCWLSTPLPEQDSREPFLIQVYFGGRLPDEDLLPLLRRELQVTEERLAVYEAIYAANRQRTSPIADERAIFLSLLTLEVGYTTNQAIAQWLRTAVARLETHDYTIHIGEQ